MKKVITQEYLKECFDYNYETGVFTWRHRPEGHFKTKNAFKRINARQAGNVSGGNNCDGYLIIHINRIQYLAHRLAWLYVYGEFPILSIDHINQNRKDNRIENLRDVTLSANQKNKTLHPKNKTGINGVSKTKGGKYKVKIDGKYIGTFEDIEMAELIAREAMIDLGFHENHGRKPQLSG